MWPCLLKKTVSQHKAQFSPDTPLCPKVSQPTKKKNNKCRMRSGTCKMLKVKMNFKSNDFNQFAVRFVNNNSLCLVCISHNK